MVRSPAKGASERDGDQPIVFPVPKYPRQAGKIEFEKFHSENSKGVNRWCFFRWETNCLLEKS